MMRNTIALATAAWLFAGCAAPLDDPEAFRPPGDTDAPDASQGTEGCALDVQADILEPRCATSGCHDASSAAGLDVTSADLALHLYEMESMGCVGRMLIDAENPDDSYLLERVGDAPDCNGEPVGQMPATGEPLTPEERDCLRAWVRDSVTRLNAETP